MGKKNRRRVSTESSSEVLSNNPFASLSGLDLPQGQPAEPKKPLAQNESSPKKPRGRLDVIRSRSKGGGWVTIIAGFKGISNEEKNDLKKRIQKRCGVGGTLKEGKIEIQGDKRDEVKLVLEDARFQVVFAGG